MKSRAVLGYGLLNGPLVVAYFLLPAEHMWLWGAIGLGAAIAVVVGVRLRRPQRPLAWYLVSAALATFVAGDTTYNYLTSVLHEPNPFPSAADACYLATYPLFAAAMFLFLRSRTPTGDRIGLIDAMVVTTGCGLLAWAFLIQPYVTAPDMTVVQKLISIAYPLGDVLVICMLTRLLAAGGLRNRSIQLLALGGLGLLVADVLYGLIQLEGTWRVGGPVDIGWVLFYLAWAAAALHPDMAAVTARSTPVREQTSRLRLMALSAMSLVAPSLLGYEVARGDVRDGGTIAGASVLLFGLVLARLSGLLEAQRTSIRREQALRRVGEQLVAAGTVDHVLVAGAETVAAVGAATREVRCSLARIGASGAVLAADPWWEPFRIDEWGGEAEQLRRGEPAVARLPGAAADQAGATTLLPVRCGEELVAVVLCAAVGVPVPATALETLGLLVTQLELALSRVRLAEDLLQRESEAHFRSLIQNSTDVILVVQGDGTITYQTPSARTVLGFGPDDLSGSSVLRLVHPDDREAATAVLAAALGVPAQQPLRGSWRVSHRDGRYLDAEVTCNNLSDDHNVGGLVLTLADITDRLRLENELRHQAFHDSLTGLANRTLFRDRVAHALRRARRTHDELAVLLVDLDDFKIVNDTLGHPAGDELLVQVAGRLQQCVRDTDTTARLGGDEFGILIERAGAAGPGPASEADRADTVAERIMAAFEQPLLIEGHSIDVRLSIGIATNADDADDAEDAADLLRHADLALYAAKDAGKSSYHAYQPLLHEAMVHKLERRAALEAAIRGGELEVFYQPIVTLETEDIVSLEALARWRRSDGELVQPGEFIALAEETGLVVPLGATVLTTACADLHRWQHSLDRPTPLRISVNVSVRQLQAPFIELLDSVLARYPLHPGTLVLEITESVLMQETPELVQTLQQIRARDVLLALDDFGTGYSSLGYLHRFPINVLKIDKSFVDALDTDSDRGAVVRAIVALGHNLGLELVAEGVERPGQRAQLRLLGCEYGQGFLHGRPMSGADVEQVLRSGVLPGRSTDPQRYDERRPTPAREDAR